MWLQKREGLSLMADRVLLVEYLEEHPLLLSRPGAAAFFRLFNLPRTHM